MPPCKTSKTRIQAAEHRAKIMEARRMGYTFKQIGHAFGCTEQRAHQIVTKELERITTVLSETTDAVRLMEIERLDDLLRAQMPQAKAGHQGAAQTVLRIMERRSRLLGLDMPAKIEAEVKRTGGRIDLSALSDEQLDALDQITETLNAHQSTTAHNE